MVISSICLRFNFWKVWLYFHNFFLFLSCKISQWNDANRFQFGSLQSGQSVDRFTSNTLYFLIDNRIECGIRTSSSAQKSLLKQLGRLFYSQKSPPIALVSTTLPEIAKRCNGHLPPQAGSRVQVSFSALNALRKRL